MTLQEDLPWTSVQIARPLTPSVAQADRQLYHLFILVEICSSVPECCLFLLLVLGLDSQRKKYIFIILDRTVLLEVALTITRSGSDFLSQSRIKKVSP